VTAFIGDGSTSFFLNALPGFATDCLFKFHSSSILLKEESMSNKKEVISVVVPIYKEEGNVKVFAERLKAVFDKLGCRWELVFALDPSPDSTLQKVHELIDAGYPIRLLTFSRRIGKPLSVVAGLDNSLGDATVVTDVDLQDPPELIETMVYEWRKGAKVVVAQRASRRGESFAYLKAAELFYWIMARFTDIHVAKNTGDFRLLDSRVVKEVCRFRERHGFLRGISASTGFKTAMIQFDRDPRFSGKSNIRFKGAIEIALDGIFPFSRTPVRAVTISGIAFIILAFLAGITGLIIGATTDFPPYWPFIGLGILVCGLSGIILLGVGIVGEYVVRTYEETRSRPLYIIDQIQEADSVPNKLNGV
jgi:polyisoprenyl-phosphate glycosyltransferase